MGIPFLPRRPGRRRPGSGTRGDVVGTAPPPRWKGARAGPGRLQRALHPPPPRPNKRGREGLKAALCLPKPDSPAGSPLGARNQQKASSAQGTGATAGGEDGRPGAGPCQTLPWAGAGGSPPWQAGPDPRTPDSAPPPAGPLHLGPPHEPTASPPSAMPPVCC